jgi:hypothetical protein
MSFPASNARSKLLTWKNFISGVDEGTERRSRQLQFSAAICRSELARELVIA